MGATASVGNANFMGVGATVAGVVGNGISVTGEFCGGLICLATTFSLPYIFSGVTVGELVLVSYIRSCLQP